MKYFLAVATLVGHRGNRDGTQREPWVYEEVYVGVKVAGTGSQWRWADSGAPVELP